jgi:alkylation response protein AidB-like acyl-CoA dehydrogenase
LGNGTVTLTEDQVQLRQLARDIADRYLAASAVECDRNESFDRAAWEILKKHGIPSLPVPIEHGGLGQSVTSGVLVMEQLARTNASAALSFLVPYIVTSALRGSPHLAAKHLPAIATGEDVGCFILTEAEAGSDAGALRTTARRTDAGYVISGRKQFISNGDVANFGIVYARTGEPGPKGISAFAVDMKTTPGLSIGRHEQKMGMRGCTLVEVVFEDVVVRQDQLVGVEGQGLRIALEGLSTGRVLIAALGVGLAQGALDFAIDYAKQREQFGRPISANQGLRWLMADLHTQLTAARTLALSAAEDIDRGYDDAATSASMAKLFCTDMCMTVTTEAVQILGGYGYLRDYPVERMMRDAKILQIFEGTNQIQRNAIAKSLVDGVRQA